MQNFKVMDVRQQIKMLLHELVPESEFSESDIYVNFRQRIDGVELLGRLINTYDRGKLSELFQRRYRSESNGDQILSIHSFIENSLVQAQNLSNQLKEQLKNAEDRELMKGLQDWKDYLIDLTVENEILFPMAKIDTKDFYSYFEDSGQLKLFAESGITINPTDNFRKLVPVREELYLKTKAQFLNERNNRQLETSEDDFASFRNLWLESELKVIDRWHSDKHPNGEKKLTTNRTIELIELNKYKRYILEEIKKANLVFNPAEGMEKSSLNRIDFTQERLEPFILELSRLPGTDSPIPYLNEKVKIVRQFEDFGMLSQFYIHVHHLCRKHAEKFKLGSHQKEIIKWLKSGPLVENVFDNTWNKVDMNSTIDSLEYSIRSTAESIPIEQENDLTKSTIEDYFDVYKQNLNEPDYNTLVDAYYQFLKFGTFPVLESIIQFRNRIPKKKVGWAINCLLKSENKNISIEVLNFSLKNLSVFTDETFDEGRFRTSNLYKYHTTNYK